MTDLISPERTLLCALVLAATSMLACPTAAAQTAPAGASLSDLDFVEGKWTGTFRGDRDYEAYWSGPTGGALMGMIRFIRDDETLLFELLTVERTERGLVLSVKHFDPGLRGREEKDDAVRYRLVEMEDERAVFEHEGDGSRIAWEGGFDRVTRGTLENGRWVWTDLFVGERTE